jgi:hypothetical protein
MTSEVSAAQASRKKELAGTAGKVTGIVGIVVCGLMVVGVLIGHGWASNEVEAIAQKIDAGLARAEAPLATATGLVAEVTDRVTAVAVAADALAADPNAAPGRLQPLLAQVDAVSNRYLAFRSSYADAREAAVSTLDRLQMLARIMPGFSVPQGPVDLLASVDAVAKNLDAKVMTLIDTNLVTGATNKVAQGVADGAHGVESALGGFSTKLGDASTGLASVRADVASTAATTRTAIVVGAVVLVIAFIYLAALHFALYRLSAGARRDETTTKASDTPSAPEA